MASVASNSEEHRARFPAVLIGLALAVSLAVTAWGLASPLADLHGFRQTQTAISVYWMLNGGPWLDYWTPVLGAPWSAPFEFPLYQWIVAGLVGATGLPIDAAGRLVSYGWLLLGAWPARRLADDLGLPPLAFPFFAILVLLSPVYLFWGRSFMIETQAVTLCLFFLWWGRRALAGEGIGYVLLASLAFVLAALTKITTCLPFVAALGVIGLLRLVGTASWPGRIALVARGLAIVAPGALLFSLWNARADALKAANPLAAQLRSDAPRVVQWNFGTLHERLSGAMLEANLRAVQDMFGIFGLFVLIGIGWAVARARPERRAVIAVLACIALYFLPWLVLTNLHIIHDYYQSANAIFALAAAAIAIASVAEATDRRLALLLCGLVVVSQAGRFAIYQSQAMARLPDGGDLPLAALLKRETRPDQNVVVYGRDWSAMIPYYAGRKALMEPEWAPADVHRRSIPERVGGPIGAVVHCPSALDSDAVAAGKLIALERRSRVTSVGPCKVLLAPRTDGSGG